MKQKLEVDSESLKDNLKIYMEMLDADGSRKYPNGSEDRKRNLILSPSTLTLSFIQGPFFHIQQYCFYYLPPNPIK